MKAPKSAPVAVGDHVMVHGYEGAGRVRFVGLHKTKNLPRVGVELGTMEGKNNGTVNGHKYFVCKDNYGVLVDPTKVTVTKRAKKVTLSARKKPAPVQIGLGDSVAVVG
jgi:dynactin complex subunit